MSIISSRRSFLKLFGASAAVVAAVAVAPVNPAVIEAAVGPLPVRFPPNILHVNLDGVWTALSEVCDIQLHDYVHEVPVLSFAGGFKPFKGNVDTTAVMTSIFRGENHHLFEQLGDESGHRRYAFSTNEQIYEYDALMMSHSYGVCGPGEILVRKNHFAIISDVQVSQNG